MAEGFASITGASAMRRALIVGFTLSTVLSSAFAHPPENTKRANLAQLIEQLADRDFHIRDVAQKSLANVGVEALPELKKARAHSDPEVRRRLDEVIPPLARKLALSPKLITLHMIERPMRDVLAELTRQTGYKIGAWPDSQPNNRDPNVYTFHLDNVPFWQALDQICEAGGLSMQQNWGDDMMRLYAQDIYVPFVSYQSAFRIVATGFTYNRNNQFGQMPRNVGVVQPVLQHDNLQLTLTIAAEPKLPMMRAGAIRILEAEDDEHHSMIAPAPEFANDPFNRRYYYPGNFRSFLQTSQAQLLPASKTAQFVKKLRGVIPVTIVSEQKELVVTDRLLTSKGKKFKAGGITFHIEDVTELPGKQYQFRVTVSEDGKSGNFSDGSLFQSLQQRMQIQDDKGVVRPFNLMSTSTGNNSIQFTFMLQPQAGNVGNPTRLVYLAWETLEHEVEFEFHDLPLP
jgi:hypothetical protein